MSTVKCVRTFCSVTELYVSRRQVGRVASIVACGCRLRKHSVIVHRSSCALAAHKSNNIDHVFTLPSRSGCRYCVDTGQYIEPSVPTCFAASEALKRAAITVDSFRAHSPSRMSAGHSGCYCPNARNKMKLIAECS